MTPTSPNATLMLRLSTMRNSLIGFLVGLVCNLTTVHAQAAVFQLSYLGTFKAPTGNWEILKEKKTGTNAKFAFTVLRNTSTGDLLSFAVYDKPGSELRTLVDSAHELFPDGRPATGNPLLDERFSVWSLRWSITDVLNRSQQVLEYSFVAEHKIREKSRLAHGYVLVGDVTVFVQHTSTRPITPELAQEVSATVLRRLVEKSDPANLKKSNKRIESHR